MEPFSLCRQTAHGEQDYEPFTGEGWSKSGNMCIKMPLADVPGVSGAGREVEFLSCRTNLGMASLQLLSDKYSFLAYINSLT